MSGKGRVYPPLRVRFWASVDKRPGFGPDGTCWRWTAWTTPQGYGQIKRPKDEDDVTDYAHRVSYEIHHGVKLGRARTSGVLVLHRCDNPSCVRPDHLFLGDDKTNSDDMHAKGRHKTGDQKGLANPGHKLTEDEVRQIRKAVGTLDDIGDVFGVCKATVSVIKRRIAWSHLT